MSCLNSKKGQFKSYGLIIIFLFGFAIISILASVLMNGFIDGFTDAGIYNGAVQESGDKFLSAVYLHDYIILLVAIVLIIGVGIQAYRSSTPRVFFVVSVLMAVFLGLTSYFFNFVFVQLVSDAIFNSVIIYFPRTLILCSNFHWLALIMFIVGSIVLYTKKDDNDVVGGGFVE